MPTEVNPFKFCLGTEEDRLSSIWQIKDKNGSIYIFSASTGGDLKITVHPDICHFGFTTEFWSERAEKGELSGPRNATGRWKRKVPQENKAEGIAFIQFPTDFLKTALPLPTKKRADLMWF